MRFTMPETFKISVTATCPSHARTDLKARQHTLLVDEPPQRGGTDLGPTPLETLLSSYLACTNVVANMIADEMGIEIEALSMDLTASFDTRGVFGKAEVTAPFPRIDLAVEVTTGASDAEIDALKRALARRCPVSVILRQAGAEIVENWIVSRG